MLRRLLRRGRPAPGVDVEQPSPTTQSYCFRIRLRLGPRVRVGADSDELVFADGADGGERVVLRSHGDPSPPMNQAVQLVLRGEGYGTAVEAEEAASRWSGRLRFAFAGSLIGADFGGLLAPRMHFTPFGLQMISGQQGRRVLQDIHGMQVFECKPDPVFVNWDLDLIGARSSERLLELVATATEKGVTMNDAEELAFDLYSGSFFEPTADGRFLMLMMAVETLALRESRTEAAVAHVDQLIAATAGADLPSEERESLIGALGTLKQESTSRACQRLARSLGGRTYMEEAPPAFVGRCYRLRSRLVHGEQPRPTFDEVNQRVGALESFVSDLLSLPLTG